MGGSPLKVLETLISVWGAVTIHIHMESCNVDIHHFPVHLDLCTLLYGTNTSIKNNKT